MTLDGLGRYDARYDEALEHLRLYAPERRNGFTNHGPMAVEALAAMGLGDELGAFVEQYVPVLHRAAPTGPALDPNEQASALGRADAFSRWQTTFQDLLACLSARAVAATWIPILAPGCFAAAFHGALMTAHALRALEDRITTVRVAELARGLAYWAATYQPLPGKPCHAPEGTPLQTLLGSVRVVTTTPGGSITAAVGHHTLSDRAFAELVSQSRAIEADPVAVLASAGARALLLHPDLPIVFVHAITGPVAFRTLSRWIDAATAHGAIDYLWQAAAGLLSTYIRTPLTHIDAPRPVPRRERLIELALETRDEHAIKVVEAALREYAISADETLLHAAACACERIRRVC